MNYSGADMQIAEWKDRQQDTANQLAVALARVAALEAALREVILDLTDVEDDQWEENSPVGRALALIRSASETHPAQDAEPMCRDGKPHDFIAARFGRTETCHKCGEQK